MKNIIGFTLIELLIVVSIIMILASLLLPALRNAKEMGSRTLCISNLKQIYLGASSYSLDYNGYIPPGHQYPIYLVPLYVKAELYPRFNTGPFVCPSTSPCDGTPEAPRLMSYSGTLYPDWLDESGLSKYGGWYKSRTQSRIAKKIDMITDNSVIMTERKLYNYVGTAGWQYNMPDSYTNPYWAGNPLHPNFLLSGPAYRHVNTSNMLFKEGHVRSVKYFAVFDNDWKIK